MSTMSGITLVFGRPFVPTTFGENVVCVQACRKRLAARVAAGPPSSSSIADSSSSAAVISSSSPSDATCPRHSSWKRGVGPVLGEARHDLGGRDQGVVEPYGIDPWPGVPRTRSRRQATPFSPTDHVDAATALVAVVQPAALGQQVVAADRVGCSLGHPAGAVGAARPPRRRRRSRAGRPSGGSRGRTSDRNTTAIDDVRLSMSTAPRPHTSTVDQLAAERVVTPAVGVHRHDVGVAHQAQRRAPRDRCPGCGRRTRPGPASAPTARCRRRSPRRRSAARRRCGSRNPTRRVPSLTHWLRISVCSSSTVSPVRSEAMRSSLAAIPTRNRNRDS